MPVAVEEAEVLDEVEVELDDLVVDVELVGLVEDELVIERVLLLDVLELLEVEELEVVELEDAVPGTHWKYQVFHSWQ